MIKAIKSLKEIIAERLRTDVASVAIVLYDSSSGVHLPAEDFYNQYNPEELQKGQCTIIAKIDIHHDTLGTFMMKDMVGCAGLMIFHDLFIMPEFRNYKLGSSAFEFAKEFAMHYGYGMLQATDREDNEHATKLFLSKGWTKTSTFKNPKTGNNICIWNLKLN